MFAGLNNRSSGRQPALINVARAACPATAGFPQPVAAHSRKKSVFIGLPCSTWCHLRLISGTLDSALFACRVESRHCGRRRTSRARAQRRRAGNPAPKSTPGHPKSTVDLREEKLNCGKNGLQTPFLPGLRHSFRLIATRKLWDAGQMQTDTGQKMNPPLPSVSKFWTPPNQSPITPNIAFSQEKKIVYFL
jgi:hypothetical protein